MTLRTNKWSLRKKIPHLLTFLLAISGPCLSQDGFQVRGEVQNTGNPDERKTVISVKPTENSIALCDAGKRYAIAQLPGAIISVTGRTVTSSRNAKKCFFAESFLIHEIASGRPAIIGVLKKLDPNVYAIVGEDGRTWRLSSLTPGLKSLVGNTIISDLIVDSASNNETRWLVVRMFTRPD
jgi:hypothetical protein